MKDLRVGICLRVSIIESDTLAAAFFVKERELIIEAHVCEVFSTVKVIVKR
jgi:hypothetical protein